MKRRLRDRKDGYRLTKTDPFFRIIPHIMKDRSDAQVFFEERIYLENTRDLIRKLRKKGERVGFLHIVIAALVRIMSQKPKVNRFISGKKAYARNEITISLVVKKEMTQSGDETTIKLKFDPNDTILDVCHKLNNEIDKNKETSGKNSADKLAKIFSYMPNFLLSLSMGFIKFLDRHGWLPKTLIDVSPFHTSAFVTDLGSLGIKPVFHHIYNFGTTSIFLAFGMRSKEQIIEEGLTVTNKKVMDLKIVVDERIVDGYYFANAVKEVKRYLHNPQILLEKPEKIYIDDEI
ncbi:MAG: 2-oxo acid dehydrogenase subunit E2 [Candidatus Izimaplasma sp.]|nr:2-oxo acid dehydrogenase subunit E2 [Candidatus Izimaplasma bacterium]